jgi:HD superfamily phosphohydrolase
MNPMRWGARLDGERVVRDPIHGDIPIPELHGSIIDTLVFQRLRYVRQNGLLHFVFPGAVHTRFVHSIGTMANAQAVWHRLSARYLENPSTDLKRALEYLGAIFEAAALLHDVGHCAFSHSSERVRLGDGTRLFGTVESLYADWHEGELLAAYKKANPKVGEEDADHEAIGIPLIRRVFADLAVAACAEKELEVSASQVGQDVIAVLNESFDVSDGFREHSARFVEEIGAKHRVDVDAELACPELRSILHRLVSGTLDVDRMDYLLRDAMFCGVPYGQYDRELLIGSLEILPNAGSVLLTLDGKAALALDDLLWSRHQMFLQVYNHKTNVAMNHMLSDALAYAMAHAHLLRPRTYEDYIAFTDDLVMGKVFDACSRGEGVRNTPFGRTLTRRGVPMHLGSVPLTETSKDARKAEIQRWVSQKREELGGGDQIVGVDAGSDLIKGALPTLRFRDRVEGTWRLEAFAGRSSILNSHLTPNYSVLHFYDLQERSAA